MKKDEIKDMYFLIKETVESQFDNTPIDIVPIDETLNKSEKIIDENIDKIKKEIEENKEKIEVKEEKIIENISSVDEIKKEIIKNDEETNSEKSTDNESIKESKVTEKDETVEDNNEFEKKGEIETEEKNFFKSKKGLPMIVGILIFFFLSLFLIISFKNSNMNLLGSKENIELANPNGLFLNDIESSKSNNGGFDLLGFIDKNENSSIEEVEENTVEETVENEVINDTREEDERIIEEEVQKQIRQQEEYNEKINQQKEAIEREMYNFQNPIERNNQQNRTIRFMSNNKTSTSKKSNDVDEILNDLERQKQQLLSSLNTSKRTSQNNVSYVSQNQNLINNNTYENVIVDKIDDYVLMQGSIIPSVLITEVNTDLEGDILGQVREDVYDTTTGKYLLIPKGSKIYGKYNSSILAKQNRVEIVWSRLMLPNGKSVNLSNLKTVDSTGNSGIKDKVNYHYLDFLGDAIFTSILNLGNTLAETPRISVGGLTVGLNGNTASDKNSSSSGSSSPFKQTTNKMLEKTANQKPTLKIRSGYKFNILVNSDVYLEEYKY